MKILNASIWKIAPSRSQVLSDHLLKNCRGQSRMLKMYVSSFAHPAQSGTNYIEANEAFSKKEFVLRVKICRKEAKESRYWLRLIETSSETTEGNRSRLVQEAQELTNIFGAIIRKSE